MNEMTYDDQLELEANLNAGARITLPPPSPITPQITIQRQECDGKWTDETRINEFIDRVVADELRVAGFIEDYAPRNRNQVIEALQNGQTLKYDLDWYANIRQTPQSQNSNNHPALIVCDCGHSVRKEMVMAASMGTSCTNCYDRMSD